MFKNEMYWLKIGSYEIWNRWSLTANNWRLQEDFHYKILFLKFNIFLSIQYVNILSARFQDKITFFSCISVGMWKIVGGVRSITKSNKA
jgi:hypothetical protein